MAAGFFAAGRFGAAVRFIGFRAGPFFAGFFAAAAFFAGAAFFVATTRLAAALAAGFFAAV